MGNAIIITKPSIREMQNVTPDMADAMVASYADAGMQIHWQVCEEDDSFDMSLVVPSDQRDAAFQNVRKLLEAGEIVLLFEEKAENRGFEIWHRVAASDRTMVKMQKRVPQETLDEILFDFSEALVERKYGYQEGKPVYGTDLFLLLSGCQCW